MVYCMTLNTRNFEVFLVWTLCQQWHVNIVVHKLGKPAKGKPKHYFIPYFVLSNNLFQCWYIKDVKHHQHYMYIPKTILEMRPSIFCLRKLSRELILDWYCSIEIPIFNLLLTKSWVSSRLLLTVCVDGSSNSIQQQQQQGQQMHRRVSCFQIT